MACVFPLVLLFPQPNRLNRIKLGFAPPPNAFKHNSNFLRQSGEAGLKVKLYAWIKGLWPGRKSLPVYIYYPLTFILCAETDTNAINARTDRQTDRTGQDRTPRNHNFTSPFRCLRGSLPSRRTANLKLGRMRAVKAGKTTGEFHNKPPSQKSKQKKKKTK